jgi:hypothetical protein
MVHQAPRLHPGAGRIPSVCIGYARQLAPVAQRREEFWQATLEDGTKPMLGGWNRICIWVEDLDAEIARLQKEGVKFRRDDVLSGPGGSQIWSEDPSGNLVELFQMKP